MERSGDEDEVADTPASSRASAPPDSSEGPPAEEPSSERSAADRDVGPDGDDERDGVEAAAAERRQRRWRWVRVALFAAAGSVLAVVLFGRVPAKVGPFETTMSARPSLSSHTVVHLAPLGTIGLDTHDWPLSLDLRVDEIALADVEALAADPTAIDRLGDDAADEVREALIGLAIRCVVVALLGGVAGALVARLSWRAAATGAGVAGLLAGSLGLGVAATFNAEAVSEPRYTGLLTRAPTAVGDIEDVLGRFGEYRAQLSDLVDNMATLYLAGSELPTFQADGDLIRILHVSDIHLNPQAFDLMDRLTGQFGVDAIVDTGDLTDWGTDPELQLIERIGRLDVPYVYVRGNHDSRRTQAAVAEQENAVVLDGDAETVAGLRFWGIGDPRYTPDKNDQDGRSNRERAEAFAPEVASRLADDEPPPIDVALVHDERMAGELGGQVPLVLAGHTHDAKEGRIEPLGDADDGEAEAEDEAGAGDGDDTVVPVVGLDETLLLVEGSTGGAGLRGLQGEEPEPLTASVLYFDPNTRMLVAYDRITVGWLSDTGATIERRIVGASADDDASDDDAGAGGEGGAGDDGADSDDRADDEDGAGT
jgi:predicted phosphodiesterase